MNLPTDQRWLLEQMGSLTRSRGQSALLSAPIIEPSTKYFPDPWEPSPRGLWRVCRRLLCYAGLDDYDVDIALGSGLSSSSQDVDGFGSSHRIHGAAAWFYGIQKGTCLIGFDPKGLDDPDGLVGALAHEVGHVYRTHHRIAEADREMDEPLTDLTAVYLGFGILTTNASYRYRTSGGPASTEYSHRKTGYIPPHLMAFLLAAQIVLRDRDGRLAGRVTKQLQPNQAKWFKESLTLLDRDDLIKAIGLRAGSSWPDPLPVRIAPLPDPPPHLGTKALPEADPDFNRGKPVYRVRNNLAGPILGLGALLGLPAGAWLTARGSGFAYFLLLPTIVGILGFLFGRTRIYFKCSDPGCRIRLSERDPVCPGCGGLIQGTIKHADDRLKD